LIETARNAKKGALADEESLGLVLKMFMQNGDVPEYTCYHAYFACFAATRREYILNSMFDPLGRQKSSPVFVD
jgi:hypothetical protein